MYIILNKTIFGYELKACGYNRNASDLRGHQRKAQHHPFHGDRRRAVRPRRRALLPRGTGQYTLLKALSAMGFNGIPVALLATSNPIGTIFTALFISYIQVGGDAMQPEFVTRDHRYHHLGHHLPHRVFSADAFCHRQVALAKENGDWKQNLHPQLRLLLKIPLESEANKIMSILADILSATIMFADSAPAGCPGRYVQRTQRHCQHRTRRHHDHRRALCLFDAAHARFKHVHRPERIRSLAMLIAILVAAFPARSFRCCWRSHPSASRRIRPSAALR